MRHDREVFYGPVPYWPGGTKWFSEKDRWWGCEVSFHLVLDRAFTVKNIKRGAVPNKELKKAIYEKINPTIRSFLEQVDEVWDEYRKKKLQQDQNESGEHITGHEQAEEIVKDTPTDITTAPVDDPESKEKELFDRLSRDRTSQDETAWVTK